MVPKSSLDTRAVENDLDIEVCANVALYRSPRYFFGATIQACLLASNSSVHFESWRLLIR
jgi:hypothetical protein